MSVTEVKPGVEWINDGAEAKHHLSNGNMIHYKRVDGIYFHIDTPDEVIRQILWAKRNNVRVHLHIGDPKTGRDWLEEFETEGRIGNSMGPLKVLLLIHNARSMGGGSLLDHCVVKIRTTGKKGRVLYQHPTYHHGKITVRDLGEVDLTIAVDVDGKTHARFKTLESAGRWATKLGVQLSLRS